MKTAGDFQDELTDVLQNHADHKFEQPVRLTHEEIADALNQYATREGQDPHWNEQKVGRVLRCERALEHNDIIPFIWSVGFAPYSAARAIERNRNTNLDLVKSIIPFDPESFRPSLVPQLNGSGPQAHHLNAFPATDSFEITLFRFEPRQDTGVRHRRQNYFEIVICLRGEISVEFESPDAPDPIILRSGRYLAFDAAIPHRACESKKRPSKAEIIIVSIRKLNLITQDEPA